MLKTIDTAVEFELKQRHTARVYRKCSFPYTNDVFEVYIDSEKILATRVSSFSVSDHNLKRLDFVLEGQKAQLVWKWSPLTGDPKYVVIIVEDKMLTIYGEAPSDLIVTLADKIDTVVSSADKTAKSVFKDLDKKQSDFSDQPVSPSKSAKPQVKIISQENACDLYEIVDEEEFPLDNRAGSDVLQIEHEVSKTITNRLSADYSKSIQGQFSVGVLELVKSEVSAQLSKDLGQSVEQSITKRQQLTFSVKPNDAVVYKIRWRAKMRKGEFKVAIGSENCQIPFQVCLGLSVEVASQTVDDE